jgi:hypothetical protein
MAYFGWPEAHENDVEHDAPAGLAILDAVAKQRASRVPVGLLGIQERPDPLAQMDPRYGAGRSNLSAECKIT